MLRVAFRLNVLSVAMALAFAGGAALVWGATHTMALAVGVGLIGIVAAAAPRVALQWERAVVLRLGRFVGLRGPGLFWVVPFVDSVSSWVDQRTVTTSFAAEQTLTKDTVLPRQQAAKNGPALGRPASDNGGSVTPRPC